MYWGRGTNLSDYEQFVLPSYRQNHMALIIAADITPTIYHTCYYCFIQMEQFYVLEPHLEYYNIQMAFGILPHPNGIWDITHKNHTLN